MLDLYQYELTNGGSGHVSGYDEADARKRLAEKGLTDIKKIEPLNEDDPDGLDEVGVKLWDAYQAENAIELVPGWPPSAQLQVQLQEIMATPDVY